MKPMTAMMALAENNYKELHNDILLGDRVFDSLNEENREPEQTLFVINRRCEIAKRFNRIYHA